MSKEFLNINMTIDYFINGLEMLLSVGDVSEIFSIKFFVENFKIEILLLGQVHDSNY